MMKTNKQCELQTHFCLAIMIESQKMVSLVGYLR